MGRSAMETTTFTPNRPDRRIAIGRRRPDATARTAGLTVARATILAVLLGLLWRIVRYALGFPLWGDEAFVAVTLLERDFAGLWRPPEFFQIAPPGFLWAEWGIVRALGPGEWALRLIPSLAGVASLLLFWRFCRETTTRRTTLLAVAILAASFYPVRHATEVKPYATDLLVSMVLTVLGWSVYRRPGSAWRWRALIGSAGVGVWCSYPAVFPAASVVLLLGIRALRDPSGRTMRRWAALVAVLAASWVAMYLTFAAPQARAADFLTELKTWRDAFPPVERPWRLPWWSVRVHAGMMLAYPHGGHDFGSIATALLVVAGCVRMARRRARRPLLLLLLGPMPPAMIAAALHRYPYGTSTRVMLYMAPAFCLLAGEGLMAVLRLRHRARRGPIVAAGLLACLPIGGIVHDFLWPYFGFDTAMHRRLSHRVAALASPGDEFAVFNGVTPPPRIPDLMITRWLQRVAVARYDLRSALAAPIRWEPDPETVHPRPGGRAWLIVHRHGDERFFPEDRLAAYQSALAAHLGTPQFVERFDLPHDESWTLWAYPAARRPNTSLDRSVQ